MPQLQIHMLRVTGVASLICDNFQKPIDKNSIIVALLLHDMGNMSKIKLDRFPEFVQPEGKDYWSKVLGEFKQRYGENDYQATYKILKELKTPKKIQNLVHSNEFAKMTSISKARGLKRKICIYSDARVTPHGVDRLNIRLKEVRERWIKYKGVSADFFDQITKSAEIIETQIFAHCKIKPEDITEEKVKPLIWKLRNFNIETG